MTIAQAIVLAGCRLSSTTWMIAPMATTLDSQYSMPSTLTFVILLFHYLFDADELVRLQGEPPLGVLLDVADALLKDECIACRIACVTRL